MLLLLGVLDLGGVGALETGVMNVGVNTFAASFVGEYSSPVVIAVRP